MRYKSFTLDPFQIEAIEALKEGKSVIVSAATGTGKTLIADYIINSIITNPVNNGGPVLATPEIIYTAPIKALSNQKYREFTDEYGSNMVGIITGDVQINPTAPLVIMTTEIYRNMMISGDRILNNVKYTIFDEVHYLSDFERGTVWEEAIIFSPDLIKFLCLSATIPNADVFAGWLRSIKGHEVKVIDWLERAVPLKQMLFDSELGVCDTRAFKKAVAKDLNAYIKNLDPKTLRKLKKKRANKWKFLMKLQRRAEKRVPPPNHMEFINLLNEKDMLPVLLFLFSRRDCQNKARELAGKFDFSTVDGKAMAKRLFDSHVEPELRDLESVQLVRSAVNRGVGVHHAGLLPGLKLVVEKLFNLGHLKVLYATETFALGVNMPARTVGFLNLRKYDGFRNRALLSNEFYQCAGRAGRRGIDEIGYVVTLLRRNKNDLNEYLAITQDALEPIVSQFTLTYNTIINLVKNHSPEEREQILKSSFDYYIRRKQRKHMWVMRRYNQYLRVLRNLGYIKDEQVTNKGEFASKIYTHELLVTEIFQTGLYRQLDNIAIDTESFSIELSQ